MIWGFVVGGVETTFLRVYGPRGVDDTAWMICEWDIHEDRPAPSVSSVTKR
jgi:hypothetical protein